MKIWTFWEPPEKMPVYIQMCMETWKKFLPGVEIISLNLRNLSEYVDMGICMEKLLAGMTGEGPLYKWPHVGDAVRAMLLEKYGGIWFDCDTVVLNSNAANYFSNDKYEVIAFGDPADRQARICNISAVPHARLMRFWAKAVQWKILNFNPTTKFFWSYLGNSIVDPYVKTFDEEIFIHDMTPQMPELEFAENGTRGYLDFYFFKRLHLKDISSDMLLLHNSWTPDIFKVANFNELMYFGCTLANILFEVLEIDRSHIKDFLFFEQD